MYLDAVLTQNLQPVYNSTPEEVKEWLSQRVEKEDMSSYQVCVGQTMAMLSVDEYLRGDIF